MLSFFLGNAGAAVALLPKAKIPDPPVPDAEVVDVVAAFDPKANAGFEVVLVSGLPKAKFEGAAVVPAVSPKLKVASFLASLGTVEATAAAGSAPNPPNNEEDESAAAVLDGVVVTAVIGAAAAALPKVNSEFDVLDVPKENDGGATDVVAATAGFAPKTGVDDVVV